MTARLLQGSDAVAEAAIAAGCRFFTGYPMLPFTDLLESMARRMPGVDGVCMNVETEIEAVNMALGAGAAGARVATGSCGQGIALMQETIAEGALNEVPFVVFNMARGQQDYFQATRGGGWGDYRTLCLAPKDVPEAVEHTQLLFHLADKYRAPVMMYGDYLIAHTYVSVDVARRDYGPLPAKDWALDGTRGGTGHSRQIWTWAMGKATDPGVGPDRHWQHIAQKFDEMARVEQRWEANSCHDADTVVVSFGTAGPFVDEVVEDLRAEGLRVGAFRPITLWPFPEAALAEACAAATRVLVFEVNAGQMIDDVRLSVAGRVPVRVVGRVSIDFSGMRQGEILTVPWIRDRVRQAIGEVPRSVTVDGITLATDVAPTRPSQKVASALAPLQLTGEHHLCPGCGHPVAWRLLLEVISELDLAQRAIGVVGHGCYTNIVQLADIDFLQCLHGRAPAVATGVKRVQPQAAVFTLQGDGDVASEGLAEVLHAAARGERITTIMLNNGVFGDTGGQMTAASVVGQRTKTSLEGRSPEAHGYPVPVAELIATLPGAAYVARGAVNNAGSVAKTKRYLKRAFELSTAGAGYTFVEVLTMCPTGWFLPTAEGPDYISDTFETTYPVGVLKQPTQD